jgi:hypothetical protein
MKKRALPQPTLQLLIYPVTESPVNNP